MHLLINPVVNNFQLNVPNLSKFFRFLKKIFVKTKSFNGVELKSDKFRKNLLKLFVIIRN